MPVGDLTDDLRRHVLGEGVAAAAVQLVAHAGDVAGLGHGAAAVDVVQLTQGLQQLCGVGVLAVALTLDIDLQAVAEQTLASTIQGMMDKDSYQRGGAAVVMGVGNGEVLAMASYPTYDLETFNRDYETLAEDDRLCGEILCELLEDETGRPVSITANGRAALEMFESAAP